MSSRQRIAQLFMSGCPATGVTGDALSPVADGLVGSVILTGRSYNGVRATAVITARLQAAAVHAMDVPRLFIATDQEGGEVQVLRGPGFDDMPSALQQGTMDVNSLHNDARRWGEQLKSAGISIDLGPVLDTVPSPSFASQNPPIGGFDREFGFSPQTVSAHGTAVVTGLDEAGIDATIKHFPGLGRVTENTDDSRGVTDGITGPDDGYLQPYQDAIRAGAPLVMMSTAVYSRIDPAHDGAFSSIMIGDTLRTKLRFQGVVISDDLGDTAQVESIPIGERATDFIAAGGDLVLTVEPDQIPEMTQAVVSRIAADHVFAQQVAMAVKKILAAKLASGLL